MSLTLIVGPMKSGKSLELIGKMSPLTYTKRTLVLLQPARNVRDEHVQSRLGIAMPALKVRSLKDYEGDAEIIGIDEIHMFPVEDVDTIRNWVQTGKELYMSGLDLDYKGEIIEIIRKILELKPDTYIEKRSVCEECNEFDGRFTVVSLKNKRMRSGLPSVLPEDGTYTYGVLCRSCFLQ